MCLLLEFAPRDTSRIPARQDKIASRFLSTLQAAQYDSIEVDDGESTNVESESRIPSVEEDGEESNSQQRRSFRQAELSKKKVNFAVLSFLEIRLNLLPCLGRWANFALCSTESLSRPSQMSATFWFIVFKIFA